MNYSGVFQAIIVIILFLCGLYIAGLILEGINNAVKQIPWWMGLVVLIGGIYLYDIYKRNRG